MASSLSVRSSSPGNKESFEDIRMRRYEYDEDSELPILSRSFDERKRDISLSHTHMSLSDLRHQIATGSLSDNHLLHILAQAQIDIKWFKNWEKQGLKDCKSSEDFVSANYRKLNDKEYRVIAEAIAEDRLIVEICRNQLLKIPAVQTHVHSRQL